MNASISIIGYGRLGKLLQKTLERAGYDQISVVKKDDEILFLNDFIFITVPDESIRTVIEEIGDSGLILKDKTIAHCSGAVGLDVFNDLARSKIAFGCFHPMMAITESSNSFDGITFDVCGNDEFISGITPLADDLNAEIIVVNEEEKAKLHVAAVITSNYLVTLIGLAQELFKDSELDEKQLRKSLLPLMESVLNNMQDQTPEKALTGPISRRDLTTLNVHSQLLVENPRVSKIYHHLAEETVRLFTEEESNHELRKWLNENRNS